MIKNILIDFKRTVYDPDSDMLISGALHGLATFKQSGLYVRLVGRGTKDEIAALIKRFAVGEFFDEVCIDDDKEKFFERVENPSEWLVIGDRARKEIAYGASLGMRTLWFKNGKFSDDMPTPGQQKPDHIVSSWDEIVKTVLTEISPL